MKLSEAIKICTATGLEGWEQVEYVIGFVRTHMEYSLSNAHMTHRAAFRAGRGYCVQQAMCVRDILRASDCGLSRLLQTGVCPRQESNHRTHMVPRHIRR